MQDRYTGDIGDFGKLGLLRRLAAAGFAIGVNWYLTPDGSHNGDGRYIQYLSDPAFRVCDPPLWEALRGIVGASERQVAALEPPAILSARFYRERLTRDAYITERPQLRAAWHRQARPAYRAARWCLSIRITV